MTHAQYMRELDKILKRYAKLAKEMTTGDVQLAIQAEKHDAIDALWKRYQETKK